MSDDWQINNKVLKALSHSKQQVMCVCVCDIKLREVMEWQ